VLFENGGAKRIPLDLADDADRGARQTEIVQPDTAVER
jgi:hypothetical protein